ncbi:MAG TPA: tyrosinase family protein [Candidatus Limnocylindrales bacterium]|nr:tyrosinase family protein [Candidatus Limnocylindrales bacterium]
MTHGFESLGLTRRRLLSLATLAAGVGAAGMLAACTEEQRQKIANRPIRKNIATLAPNDPIITSYKTAITKMQALPSSDGRNWTRQAQIHNSFCRHSSWLVLPWHRAYLFYFEQICKELSGNEDFALPYWNWTTSPQIPAVFFEPGSPLNHSPRLATASSTVSASVAGPTVISNILGEGNFLLFAGDPVALNSTAQFGPGSGPLESGPHNTIHGFVGGDMGTFMSPLDPIFWTHHGRMDELWVEWNILRDNPNTNDPNWVNTEFTEFFDRKGNQVSVKVIFTVLYPYLSYRYDTQVAP